MSNENDPLWSEWQKNLMEIPEPARLEFAFYCGYGLGRKAGKGAVQAMAMEIAQEIIGGYDRATPEIGDVGTVYQKAFEKCALIVEQTQPTNWCTCKACRGSIDNFRNVLITAICHEMNAGKG